ncbi:hypothetical protein, partial [Flavobacterium sp. DSR3-2]|uniref:hypothetical protein n=1 Tax=Flavobacterium sp. DSR3-2 TaxID=2804634 RepID=UPI003CFACEE5
TFCPLQSIAKSEKVRIIKKNLFINVCSLFMLCRPSLAGNVIRLCNGTKQVQNNIYLMINNKNIKL